MFSENPVDFLKSSSIGIHAVSKDGTIIYANDHELKMLGYQPDEYVGHHVSEFQIESPSLEDMMTKLNKFEVLENYPAVVQAKNGLKYILYNTSVYHANGEFIHTRCYGTEIDASVYEFFKKAASTSNEADKALH
ncbi:PAS domain-containing protein [Oceaniferula spumae]